MTHTSPTHDQASDSQDPEERAVFGVGAAWRRGMMHAIERLDVVLARKGSATSKLAYAREALDELTELQRHNMPATYREAFEICAADHKARAAIAKVTTP